MYGPWWYGSHAQVLQPAAHSTNSARPAHRQNALRRMYCKCTTNKLYCTAVNCPSPAPCAAHVLPMHQPCSSAKHVVFRVLPCSRNVPHCTSPGHPHNTFCPMNCPSTACTADALQYIDHITTLLTRRTCSVPCTGNPPQRQHHRHQQHTARHNTMQ